MNGKGQQKSSSNGEGVKFQAQKGAKSPTATDNMIKRNDRQKESQLKCNYEINYQLI